MSYPGVPCMAHRPAIHPFFSHCLTSRHSPWGFAERAHLTALGSSPLWGKLQLFPFPQPLSLSTPPPPDMEVLSKTGSCLWVSKAATPKHLSQLCPHPTSLHPPHFQLLFHYFQHRLLCTSKQEKVFSSRVQNVFIQLNVKRKKIDLGVKCYLEAHLHVDSESWSFECFGKYFKKRVKFY